MSVTFFQVAFFILDMINITWISYADTIAVIVKKYIFSREFLIIV